LGGFGHRPQYTANKSRPGSSNDGNVNRFAHFKFFWREREQNGTTDEKCVEPLDESK